MPGRLLLLMIFISGFAVPAFAQPLGEIDTAGTTYSQSQHSGTVGRMVSEDGGGYVHVVWMNTVASGGTPRHVYYNVWDPAVSAFELGAGVQVNNTSRAGYTTQATSPGGFCFPAFHGTFPGDPFPHPCAAIDFLPRIGAFGSSCPAWIYEAGSPLTIAFPKIALDAGGALHMVSQELFMGEPPWGRIYYSRGVPAFEGGFGDHIAWQIVEIPDREFKLVDTSAVVAHDIACSPAGNRVAIAYIRTVSPYNQNNFVTDQDVFLAVSNDGGVTWGSPANITQFIPPDDPCPSGDWECCNRDTLRPHFELSTLIDGSDAVHIAFTTVRYRYWINGEAAEDETPQAARIWHWSEITGGFSLVADAWQPDVTRPLPATNAMVARPSLSRDPSNGQLYCSFLKFDSTQYSTTGRMNADVFVSVSTDNGAHWSVGVNVTNSPPETVPGGPGQNRSEMDASLALHTSESLKIFYELDRDAGAGDVPTLKSMLLQQVPAGLIPTTPLMPAAQMHVTAGPCGVAADDVALPLPRTAALHPAHPNPFNATTTVTFDVPAAMRASVRICDLLGREIATLADGMLSGGTHQATWNASGFASGIYFFQLRAGAVVHLQKVVLLK